LVATLDTPGNNTGGKMQDERITDALWVLFLFVMFSLLMGFITVQQNRTQSERLAKLEAIKK
jgi:hypothetical protein